MNSRVRELENQLDFEDGQRSTTERNLRRSERLVRELEVQAEERERNKSGMEKLMRDMQVSF